MRKKQVTGFSFQRLRDDRPNDPNWGPAVQAIAPQQIIMEGSGIGESTRLATEQAKGQFEMAQHWVYKLHWEHRHVIPGQRKKNVQAAKPFAEILVAWISICERLHGETDAPQYPHAAAWFSEICTEIQMEYLSLMLGSYWPSELSIFHIGEAREIASKIQRYTENPFDVECQLHQWRAADLMLRYQREDRYSNIWSELYSGSQRQKEKGLGAAISAFETHRKNAPTAVMGFEKDGRFYMRDKRGKVAIERSCKKVSPQTHTE